MPGATPRGSEAKRSEAKRSKAKRSEAKRSEVEFEADRSRARARVSRTRARRRCAPLQERRRAKRRAERTRACRSRRSRRSRRGSRLVFSSSIRAARSLHAAYLGFVGTAPLVCGEAGSSYLSGQSHSQCFGPSRRLKCPALRATLTCTQNRYEPIDDRTTRDVTSRLMDFPLPTAASSA